MIHKIGLFTVCLAALGYAMLAALLLIPNWYAELAISISPQIVMALAVLMLIGLFAILIRRHKLRGSRRRYLIMATVACIVGLAAALMTLTDQKPTSIDAVNKRPTIRFASFNRLQSNTDYERIAEYIKQQNIDVIALQETDPQAVMAINDRLDYAHTASAETDGRTLPVAIISRLPILRSTSTSFGSGYAALRAEIEVGQDKPVSVYSVHIIPPFTEQMYEAGKQQLRAFGEILAADSLPVIAGGDFNTTVFSPKLDNFNSNTALAIKPTTLQPWPECSWYGYGRRACMRIDHIYIPQSAQLGNLTISPYLGSDHRMVIADINL